VKVFGVSRDSPWTHVAWSQVLGLSFPLLSDWNGEAITGLDIEHEHRGLRGVAQRTAFLVDQGGTVRRAWRYETTEVPDVDELVAAVHAS
jgi:peroxiredoxin